LPLHILAGVALLGTRDGIIVEAHPCETVTCPPNEDHWHGSTTEQFMEHLAVSVHKLGTSRSASG
jgi:quercetin dioxygenase-like cupin family protein